MKRKRKIRVLTSEKTNAWGLWRVEVAYGKQHREGWGITERSAYTAACRKLNL